MANRPPQPGSKSSRKAGNTGKKARQNLRRQEAKKRPEHVKKVYASKGRANRRRNAPTGGK